ncbi:hypothetical protein A3D00_04275 [Candidatus Woesebacteria bacterium RIFCSPHIGHO2_02_FULL_38_9]|uniref:Type II secretion system protein GspG C-terminal domain-containing protein n=1 Tax=Candidatus Woesebacteria bacterium RIFCSPHIGHO2_01_FULL_39_28 TaxID=1802496 RepID=A0A1F7YCW4_9BACT|nr:MAG: hypothetical protein A2627_00150 [Candidatus Woesebacteria bacterium RIFCSPHIGHO2_01_FULL_39_28]OGM32387.1 MAG: hypothetical protein A3D00_04275 [Candidatus Woesebacteria bacterium RIFCSPHIGHO2_02_FULL_38_9]OGM57882.1 MAG: hypothetical protein A3A50_04580 [Candidatus Woesebacteria bacterium RIFCSPLOWO2_01_FULL_38_20]
MKEGVLTGRRGFTLIELLVVVMILTLLISISLFAFQSARREQRNAKRKTDIQLIKAGLELYKIDCGTYPLLSAGDAKTILDSDSNSANGYSLTGNNSSSRCASGNIYITNIPSDPNSAKRYVYRGFNSDYYELCTNLEGVSGSTCPSSYSCNASGGGGNCNYGVTSQQ